MSQACLASGTLLTRSGPACLPLPGRRASLRLFRGGRGHPGKKPDQGLNPHSVVPEFALRAPKLGMLSLLPFLHVEGLRALVGSVGSRTLGVGEIGGGGRSQVTSIVSRGIASQWATRIGVPHFRCPTVLPGEPTPMPIGRL